MVQENKINNSYALLSDGHKYKVMNVTLSYLSNAGDNSLTKRELSRINQVIHNYFEPSACKALLKNNFIEYNFQEQNDGSEKYGISALNDIFNKRRFKILSVIKNYITWEQKDSKVADVVIEDTMQIIADKNNWLECNLLPYLESEKSKTFLLEYVDQDGCVEVRKINVTELKDIFAEELNVIRQAWSVSISKRIKEDKNTETFLYNIYSVGLNHIAKVAHEQTYVTSKDIKDGIEMMRPLVTAKYFQNKIKKNILVKLATEERLISSKTMSKSLNGKRVRVWLQK